MNRLTLKINWTVFALLMVAAWGSGARAQDTDQGPAGAPPAATGPDTATQTIENPPLSGLDQPSFEPGFGARSYLLPSIQLSEAVDTHPTGVLGSQTAVKDVSRAMGSLRLQKLWRIHPLDVDYSGGAAWYHGSNGKVYPLHSLSAIQRILWRTGVLSLRDSFRYLPQGSFGLSSFGGAGGFSGGAGGGVISGGGIAGGAGGGVFGGGQFGSLGSQPRITNSSIVDIQQSLSPRSSVVVAAGYSWTDFLNNPQGYINDQQTTAQAGYSYQLSRKDQVAVNYSFQEFHFPRVGSGSFQANVVQVSYGHRISGKLNLTVGGGPQWIQTHSPTLGTNSSVSGAGQAALTYYRSARTSLSANYSHYANPGSGFFAGANTDAIRFRVNHKLTRNLSVMADSGYSYSARVLKTPTITANSASNYNYWYAGGSVRRQLGRYFSGFVSYQYDSIGFASGFCATSTPCSRGYEQHVGMIGLDWTPRPIRLD
jgi:hypothetical protein